MTVHQLIVALLKFMNDYGGEHYVYVDPDRNTSAPQPSFEVSKGGLDPYKSGTLYVRL